MLGHARRFLIRLTLAVVIGAGATCALGVFWTLIGGGAMSVHGWIALGLGVLGTLGLTWGLMTLAFRSSREGWDDAVDNTCDPGRPEEEDR